MKRLLLLVFAAFVALLAWNTARLSHPWPKAPPATLPPLDAQALAQRLAGAVRIPTISHADPAQDDPAQLDALAAYLQQNFPRMHAALTREAVGHALLYTWPGRDAKAPPVLLLAHMDVVPVEPGSESAWTHPPFSGDIADGYVWGRGTLDDKNAVLGWCEAVESLLAQDFRPARTVVLAFGRGAGVGGRNGARAIASLLKSRGLHFEFSLDEGGAVLSNVIAGVRPPVASIMTAEKGYASLELSAHVTGGHSSRPPRDTAISLLARAVSRVAEHPLRPHLGAPVLATFERIAPELPLGARVAIANRWVFGRVLLGELTAQPLTDAMVRTTTAPTMFNAGVKDNVLPGEAHAVINFRLLPGDTLDSVQEHVRQAIGDERIDIKLYGPANNDPTPVSDDRAPAFALLERTVNQVYPDALVAPGLMIAATDTRNYAGLYDNRYNFSPVHYVDADIQRIHGTNERISVADYAQGVQWYRQLLGNLQ